MSSSIHPAHAPTHTCTWLPGCLADLRCALQAYEPQQLIKGMYGMLLPAWREVWPRDAMLLMRNEDYQASPREHMQAGFTFLGLRNLTEAEWGTVVGMKRANKVSRRRGEGGGDGHVRGAGWPYGRLRACCTTWGHGAPGPIEAAHHTMR